MKPTGAKAWSRALVVAVSLCAAGAWADCYKYDTKNGTVDLGASTQINSTDRFIIFQGTVNLNTGASVKAGGNNSGSCNFIGIDRSSVSGTLNINGGTFWCAASNGSGYLAVGNNNYSASSFLTLNSGILKVDSVLRSSVMWDDSAGVNSSGTITINGGEATVGTVLMGATTVSTGVSTLNLNGGTLTTGNITFRIGNGQVFTWGSGTLVAAQDNIFTVSAYNASNTKTRTMEITGNPAVFDTAGHTQTIPAFTGTGKLRLTGNGAVAFAQSTLPYGLVLDGIALNLGTLNANAPRLTVPSLEITGPVAISVTPPVSRTGRYPLITCTSSLDDVALGQVSVTGGAGTIEREGNTIYISLDSVTPPTLLHRWSFNGDYTDSVGGITGTNNNSSVTFINDNTAIRLAGGSKGTSWVELNPNKNSAILPPGDAPFTIEMWTTLRVRTNYSAWFTLGRKDNYNVKGLMVAFHNPNAQVRPYNNSTGTGPAFKAVKSDADANNVLMGKNPLTEGGTYHLAIVVTPRGDGDGATIEGYVHDAAGARVGGYAYTVTGWTTASLIRESFALGRNFWGDADPQADYDEVRVWNGALSISQIEANIASGPDALPASYPAATIDDSFFRYDFTHGTRVFTGNNGTDPAVTGAGNVAVNGPNGPNTAVHPKGFGTIYDGANKLNADWTIAMSVKCCNTEKGVAISVGGNNTLNKKQFVVATSSTNGKLYVPIFQKWGSSSKNIPAILELTDLGDTTNTFHTLVAVHAQGTPYDVLKGGSITLYWDGHPVGSMHAAYASGDRPFENGFQLSSAHGGFGSDLSAYSDLSGNNNLAFQDVRFFDRAISASEAWLYANAFPPTLPEGVTANEHLLHRWSFNGNLNDTGTVGGKNATLQGTDQANMTYINDNTEINLTDGGTGNNRSWISLGDNIIPAALGDTPFTVELWTTLRSRDTWRPCFGFGVDGCNGGQPGLHFAYHSGSRPIFKPTKAAASGGWQGESNYDAASTAFPLNEKCHVAFTVTPVGKGNSYVSVFIHKADGTLVGSGTWPIGSWTTSKIVQSAFMLGRSFWGDANPQASFDEVRVWKTALTKVQIEENIVLGPDVLPEVLQFATLDDFYFRYGFETGTKVFVPGGCPTEPTASAGGFMAADGPGGPRTAVHPYGYGSISDGDNKLNADWTLAMSVRSVPKENGILLGLGGNNRASAGRELRILSSQTPGKLHAVMAQTYQWGSAWPQNTPSSMDLNNLGDTTNMFHSLVAVHRIADNSITFYWDGEPKGSFNSKNNMSTLFKSWLQFCQSKNNYYAGHSDTVMDTAAAFRDVRLYTRVLEASEIVAYAQAFPAAEGAYVPLSIDDYTFRHDFTGGKLVYEGSGYTDNGLAGTGTKVMGAENCRYAAFPATNGWCSVDGGLNRDWTCAMSVKMPSGIDGNGILLSLGGVSANARRSLVLSTANDPAGGLFVKNAQRFGSAQGNVNTTPEVFQNTGLGDVTNMFHTLVVVHAKSMSDASNWKTGTFGFYWDGAYIGSVQITDGVTGRELDNMISYGCIKPYNPSLYSGNALGSNLNPPFKEIGSKDSGFAVQEMRFSTKVWSPVEAKAYAERFPAAVQAKTPGFAILIR